MSRDTRLDRISFQDLGGRLARGPRGRRVIEFWDMGPAGGRYHVSSPPRPSIFPTVGNYHPRFARVTHVLRFLYSPPRFIYFTPISFSLSLFLANSLLFGYKIYHDALYKEAYLIVSILYIYIITLERIFANKDDGIWLELARCKVNDIKIRVYLTIHDASRHIHSRYRGLASRISTELSF